MQSAINEQMNQYALKWRDAAHGTKNNVLDEAEQVFRLSRQTLYRKFKNMVATERRKQRSDAGTSSITREEAMILSATLMEHQRKNGKMILPAEVAVENLRANGLINAARVDQETGEVIPVSQSTINRALRANKVHPKQLLQPAPAVRLASEHPNHVWQIDPSRCVMAYLPQSPGNNGLRIMDAKEFYKNKPGNQIKAIKEALWRYVIVDHTSGWIYTEYVVGGETAENITNVFINCCVERAGESMHGIPRAVEMDAGSANTSAIFKNLLNGLRVKMIVNTPGNPRSKGAVEKGNDIVERHFESMLKTLPLASVQTLEQINGLATKWRKHFNSAYRHSRHGMSRNAAWMMIKPEQLIIAPPADVMWELAVTAPESRVVSTFLTVSYKGREFNVAAVPGVLVGEKLMVCRNPARELSIQAIVEDKDGNKQYHVLPEVIKNEFGFDVSAPVIGQSFASKVDTEASANLKKLEMLATNTETLEEAEKVRKAQAASKRHDGLFGERYNPLAAIEQAKPVIPMPRKGVEHELTASAKSVVMPPLTPIQAAKQLRELIPGWAARHYAYMIDKYPDGIAADAVAEVANEIQAALSESNVVPLRRAV